MKLLLIILSIITISCEESKTTETINVETSEGKYSAIIVEPNVEIKSLEIIDGTYKSKCISDGTNGYYYMMTIGNYSVEIAKFNTNSNCEQIKSYSKATYNVSGSYLDYVSTTYIFMENAGGSYACGESDMQSGKSYNIDNIDCDESFENISNVLQMNDDDNYIVDLVELNNL